jgi:hypothetical protein
VAEYASNLQFRMRIHQCACGAVIRFLESAEAGADWPEEWDYGGITVCGRCERGIKPTHLNTQVETRSYG